MDFDTDRDNCDICRGLMQEPPGYDHEYECHTPKYHSYLCEICGSYATFVDQMIEHLKHAHRIRRSHYQVRTINYKRCQEHLSLIWCGFCRNKHLTQEQADRHYYSCHADSS